MSEITSDNEAVVYAAASALGIVAGMRAMAAPAIVGYMAQSGCLQPERDRFGLFGKVGAFKLLGSLAGGEAIFDKLPFMPKRTDTAGLAIRILSGGICGATVCAAKRKSVLLGAIAGVFGAIGSTFAVYNMRASLTQELRVPDTAIALLEDATAIWMGKVICEQLRSKEA